MGRGQRHLIGEPQADDLPGQFRVDQLVGRQCIQQHLVAHQLCLHIVVGVVQKAAKHINF